jgi:hypothetical protein
MKIEDFSFHDSILKEIIVERNNPGYRDEVKIRIGFLNEDDIEVVFKDCFKANFDLNFGVIAEETIFDFYKSTENEDELKSLKEKWLKIGGCVEGLSLYCIETNSTNSKIRIFARDYKIEVSVNT